MGWLITIAILFLISIIPLGVYAQYDADGVLVRIVVGFLRYTIIPFSKKKSTKGTVSASKKKNTSRKTPVKKQSASGSQNQKGGSWKDFLPLVRIGLDFLNTFRKKLRVKQLFLKLFLAGDDPCDLAINYGRAWAALDNLLPMLERVFVIQKRDLEVECDFFNDETMIIARLEITVTVGRLIIMSAKYGYLVLKELLIIKKKRKGGAAA